LSAERPSPSPKPSPTPDPTPEPEPQPLPVTRLSFEWQDTDDLEGWTYSAEQVEIKRGGLLFKVPSRGAGTFELAQPVRLPLDVQFTVRVTTRGIGKRGVLWTTLGPAPGEGLASFAGATLYALEGEPRYLAGRRKPQALLGGRRHKVRIRFGRERTAGWLDDRRLFSHEATAGQGDLHLAFRLERGVAIDLRDLVIESGGP
jgi:hypothetical protein